MTDLAAPAPTASTCRAVRIAVGLVTVLVALVTLAPLTTVAAPSAAQPGPHAASTSDEAMTVSTQRCCPRRRTARVVRPRRQAQPADRPTVPARRRRSRRTLRSPRRSRPPTWRGPPGLLAA